MESFNEKDGLDKFLRNTFNDAEDSPSKDLWDRIESNLDEPAEKRRFPIVWWLLGLVFVLLGLVIFQHFYFSNKVDALQARTLEKVENSETTSEEKDLSGLAVEQQEKSTKNLTATPSNAVQPQAVKSLSIATETSKKSFDANIFNNKGEATRPERRLDTGNTSTDNSTISQVRQNTEELVPSSDAKILSDYPSNPQERKESTEKLAPPDFLPTEMLLIERNASTTIAQSNWHLNTSKVIPPKAESGFITWEIGGFAQAAASKLSLSAASIVRPVNRAVTLTVNQESGSTQWYGLQVKALLGAHFTLESGVAYRQTNILVGHRSSINYGERLRMAPPDWPGRDSTLSDFRYNIPTASGSYEVTVRASDVDRRDPLNDTDILLFNQVVSEKTSYLSIPLAMGYQHSFGKWGLSGSAGVWTNFLLQNEVSLERLESLNSRFRVSRRLARPQFVKNDLRKVTLDLALEARLSYEILPDVAVYAGPVWTTSILQKNKNPFIQSSLQSLGGKAGIFFRI